MKRRAFAFAVTVACSLAPGASLAQAPPPSPRGADRQEAAERFDRGLRLFNAGDSAGALAELRRAYELIPNVLVLYDIGLVYAQMGRAVEATEALDRALASPGALSAERLATARRTRDEQSTRVAEVAVAASVEGATVEVDGVEAGKTPLSQPLRVTSGTHVIGAVAPGFVPQRKEVTIAGGEKQALQLELVAMQGRLAHLAVRTHLPGADVLADDQRVGTTPLSASVSLAPGSHRVELRRPGYATARAEIVLGDGATGEVTLEPEEDPAALATMAGELRLELPETQAVVTVDGRARGVYTQPLRLAPGPHRLLVERGDFQPVARDVTVELGRTATVRVDLEPTSDYRARYVSHAQTQRTWGIISIVGGAVIAAGGTGLVLYDAKQRSDGRATITSIDAQSTAHSNQLCDPGQLTAILQANCIDPKNAAQAQVDDANTRDYIGWGAVALGGAAVVLGVTLFVTADDPHAYDRARPADAASVRVVPTLSPARGGGTVGLVGTF